jgi:hypothetical protein
MVGVTKCITSPTVTSAVAKEVKTELEGRLTEVEEQLYQTKEAINE